MAAIFATLGCHSPSTATPSETPVAAKVEVVEEVETTADRLYRRGVNCMDELNRNDCALDYFEQLIELPSATPQQVGDALFRSIEIHKNNGREGDAKILSRKFWDVGFAKPQTSRLHPLSLFAPKDITVLSGVDLNRFSQSKLHLMLSDETKEWVLTCDEARKEELGAKRDERQAQKEALKAKSSQSAPKSALRSTGAANKAETGNESDDDQRGESRLRENVGDKGICHVARALGENGLGNMNTITVGINHSIPERSFAILEISGLSQKIAKAVADGTLHSVEPNIWEVVGFDYHAGAAYVSLFGDSTLLLAPTKIMPEYRQSALAGQPTIRTELTKLAGQTAQDSAFYAVASQSALTYALANAPSMVRMLPSPDGVAVSMVLYSYVGVFTRIETSDRAKVKFIIPVLTGLLTGNTELDQNDEGDDEPKIDFTNADLTSSEDGRSVNFSVILPSQQVRDMIEQ